MRLVAFVNGKDHLCKIHDFQVAPHRPNHLRHPLVLFIIYFSVLNLLNLSPNLSITDLLCVVL
jgi:hypothetical protein